MDLSSIDFGALTIPVFIAIFGMGWTAHRQFIHLPAMKRLETLEAREEAHRREVDEELRMYRQRSLG